MGSVKGFQKYNQGANIGFLPMIHHATSEKSFRKKVYFFRVPPIEAKLLGIPNSTIVLSLWYSIGS